MMEIKELHYILTIAREGSISRAAEKLYMSQPNLSLFLKNFEDSIGNVLFYRTPSGVQPTYAGQMFIETASEIQLAYENLQYRMGGAHSGVSGTISFGIPPSKSVLYLPDILKNFQAKFPLISITIEETNSRDLEEKILRQSIDVALISTPLNNPDIIHLPITDEEIFLAASPSHPIVRLAQEHKNKPDCVYINPACISQMDFIISESGTKTRKLSDQIFADFHIQPKTVYSVSNADVAMEMVINGLGLTFISGSHISSRKKLSYFSLGENGIYRDLVMAYSQKAYHASIVEAFTNEVYNTIRPNIPQKISSHDFSE